MKFSREYGKGHAKSYPEQSARQALRGSRVAQGGPGITTGQNPQRIPRLAGFVDNVQLGGEPTTVSIELKGV